MSLILDVIATLMVLAAVVAWVLCASAARADHEIDTLTRRRS